MSGSNAEKHKVQKWSESWWWTPPWVQRGQMAHMFTILSPFVLQTAEQAFRQIQNIVDFSSNVMSSLLGEKFVHSGVRHWFYVSLWSIYRKLFRDVQYQFFSLKWLLFPVVYVLFIADGVCKLKWSYRVRVLERFWTGPHFSHWKFKCNFKRLPSVRLCSGPLLNRHPIVQKHETVHFIPLLSSQYFPVDVKGANGAPI